MTTPLLMDMFGMATEDILEFQGPYRFLSNFWLATVVLDSVRYPSVENAYQAAKFEPEERRAFEACSAVEAKRKGRGVSLREERRVPLMRDLLGQKFAPGSALAAQLLCTGSARLIEGNTWQDTYWGVCNGRGQNLLGKLLMAQRAVLQKLPHDE